MISSEKRWQNNFNSQQMGMKTIDVYNKYVT